MRQLNEVSTVLGWIYFVCFIRLYQY